MALSYVVVERGNHFKSENPKKFYAQAKASGEVTLKKLCKDIAEGSTKVSNTAVLAVLNGLIKMLSEHLSKGRIVRFRDFGAFQIALSSTRAETESKFNASLMQPATRAIYIGIDLSRLSIGYFCGYSLMAYKKY